MDRLEHGKLRPLGERRRGIYPLHLVRREHHRLVAGGCGGLLLFRCRRVSHVEHGDARDESQQCPLHDDLPLLDFARPRGEVAFSARPVNGGVTPARAETNSLA